MLLRPVVPTHGSRLADLVRRRTRYDPKAITLTTKLAVAMVALVAIAVTAVGWLSYRSLEQMIPPRVLDRIEAHSRLIASDLQSQVRGAPADIASFRSAAALNGLIRGHLAGGIDPIDGVSETIWHQRIAERLAAECPDRFRRA